MKFSADIDSGVYEVKTATKEVVKAWFNRSSGHWLNEERTKEIGFGENINGEVIKSIRRDL